MITFDIKRWCDRFSYNFAYNYVELYSKSYKSKRKIAWKIGRKTDCYRANANSIAFVILRESLLINEIYLLRSLSKQIDKRNQYKFHLNVTSIIDRYVIHRDRMLQNSTKKKRKNYFQRRIEHRSLKTLRVSLSNKGILISK